MTTTEPSSNRVSEAAQPEAAQPPTAQPPTGRPPTARSSLGKVLAPGPTWLVLAALVCFWIGERILGGPMVGGSSSYEIVRVVGGLAFMVACVLRAIQWASAKTAKPFLNGWFLCVLAQAAGMVLVFTWRGLSAETPDAVGAQVALLVALILLTFGTSVMVALQWAAEPMRQANHVEQSRLGFASMTALIAASALTTLIAINYLAAQSKMRADLSFGAPTKPSAATIALIDGAKDDVEVFMFFERGSPVVTEVGDYFEGLEAGGAKLQRLDHALDPGLSKDLKVSKNGTVAFRVGKQTDTWYLGEKRNQARRKLKKVDEEVATRLSKLTRDEKLLYFTVGHGEREERKAAKANRPGSAKLMEEAKALNVKKKKLGLAQGLGNAVPGDADLVLVLGPNAPFHEAEVDALIAYVQGGGALLLTLDPDLDLGLEPLLAALGLRLPPGEVCNDKEFVVRTRTAADHNFIISASFTSHKATRMLSKARGKAAVLFLGSGNLVEIEPAASAPGKKGKKPSGRKVTMLARSREGSFIDVTRNRVFDPKTEKRTILDLAAAVEIVDPATKSADKTDAKKSDALPGRAIVLADSEAFGDALMPNEANRFFAADSLRWLMRDDAAAGAMQTDDDVPILHTKDGDAAWFYGTTFLAPMIVLVGGMVLVRYRRRRRLS